MKELAKGSTPRGLNPGFSAYTAVHQLFSSANLLALLPMATTAEMVHPSLKLQTDIHTITYPTLFGVLGKLVQADVMCH